MELFSWKGDGKNFTVICLLKKSDGKDCTYSNKGRNTTNMKLHLQKYHTEEMKEFVSEEKNIAENKNKQNQQTGSGSAIGDFFKPNQTTAGKSQQRHINNPYPEKSKIYKTFKSDLTRLAGCTSFPLTMMESVEFQTMLFNFNSRIADSLPSRNTLKKWVVEYSMNVKRNVVSTLKLVKNYFVTMDIWSQPGLDKFYLGVVAVYFNPKSSAIEVAALACHDFPHPHTGIRIRNLFEEICAEWDLDMKKVIRFVAGKGANIVSALQPYRVIQCMKKNPSLDQSLEDCDRPYSDEHDDDDYIEIELDIEIEDEDSDDDQLESENESDDEHTPESGALQADAVNEEDAFLDDEENFRQAFAKRLTCIAHALNLIFHKVLDDRKSFLSKLRKKVLKLLKKINSSGVANQELKRLTGKKLLKIAKTRWNSFFFVLQRVLLLKSAIIKVCRDRVWGIDFDWTEVKKIVLFLKPLAMATTYLEGDKYPTAARVIPSILSLEEHFTTT